MPNWRRAHVPGGTFFFTLVTEYRAPLFRSQNARVMFGDCIRRCCQSWPFEVNAIVLLPDHLHAIWTLPTGDSNYPKRWAWIKKEFTKNWLSVDGREQTTSAGKKRDGRRGIWQTKFWEHTIESEDDFQSHFDYIHFNPVKHGLVECPSEWPWSSFHRWVRRGVYPVNWACETSNQPRFHSIDATVGE
ncbi:Transposase IS200 like protein [Symmachiella macrocystis]|uniref:Transposase IS200 like protein n=1 Tax=Symmachiella macrocystis TaxID=2527985 RepID=A0A5C6BQP7_9PLAN|nr:transposase [Symmachiella macrocystis]TWU14067.1 Transposase IS200 like protein [Symmachiella macrocystis]